MPTGRCVTYQIIAEKVLANSIPCLHSKDRSARLFERLLSVKPLFFINMKDQLFPASHLFLNLPFSGVKEMVLFISLFFAERIDCAACVWVVVSSAVLVGPRGTLSWHRR